MYPLIRRDDRTIPADYDGVVVTCDVDKTYLETDFESVGGLVAIPLEWAEDKKTVAGMAAVLRGLRHGPTGDPAQTPIYFVTASPPFLDKVLRRKMLIDGVQADGVTYKDWQTLLFKRRKSAWLKRQLAYKLCALLTQRVRLPAGAREILIGDDVETDALAYSVYADLIAGRLGDGEVAELLRENGADAEEIGEVLEAALSVGTPGDPVETVYIVLAKGRDPAEFARFGADLVPCRNAFQMAVHLHLTGRIREDAVVRAARSQIERGTSDSRSLAADLADGVARGAFAAKRLRPLAKALADRGLAGPPDTYPKPDPARVPRPRSARGGRWIAPDEG